MDLKTLKQNVQDEFEKAGFFIPSLPRDIDHRAMNAVLRSAKKWLTEKQQELAKMDIPAHNKQVIKSYIHTELLEEIKSDLGGK